MEKSEDTAEVNEVTAESKDTTTAAKDLKILDNDKSRQLIHSMKESVIKRPFIAIEQIDGQLESDEPTITLDLTISADTVMNAYCSMEDNLCLVCYGEVDKKVLVKGDETSSEV